MSDTDLSDLIEFIQHLKRGFDKDLFQSKLEELAFVAETSGIEADDFHTLFKLWLNLSIPITKWISLGACLVPQERMEARTVDYAFRWLLANCEAHTSFSRMAFLLDWLTAAMDSDSIDMTALDAGYGILYSLLSFELLTPHVLKIVYNLTKPSDVTREKVLELLDYARKREGKKNMYRQIHVLLGLFKSYKPECVPEDIPAMAIHTSFRKINLNLVARFKRSQERRNVTTKERHHLMWINPLNSEGGRHKKSNPLVPNIEFSPLNQKKSGTEREFLRNLLDFSDPVSLLQHSVQCGVARPTRLRAFLCNPSGLTVLAVCSERDQLFHQLDLQHLLACFLESSPYTYEEKADFLTRLSALQRTLVQGLPAVTKFLAQYLPFWNEKDYFAEILGLVEWLSVESQDQVEYIVGALIRASHRAPPLQQCSILAALARLYRHLAFSSTRQHKHFLSSRRGDRYDTVLPYLAKAINDICQKELQVNPEDMRVLYSCLSATEMVARADLRYTGSLSLVPGALTLALPLLSPCAALVDKIAALLLLYRKIFSAMKAANKTRDNDRLTTAYPEQRKILENYTGDFLSCLYHEHALSGRKSGMIFEALHPQLVAKLSDLVPNADGMFSLRNNLAFAAYTYMPSEAVDPSDATNKLCFETTVSQTFPNLSEFLTRAVHELRV